MRRSLIALFACLHFVTTVAGDPPPAPDARGIVSRIKREPVESTALASVGYSRRLHALEIEFKNGAIYRYLEVDRADVSWPNERAVEDSVLSRKDPVEISLAPCETPSPVKPKRNTTQPPRREIFVLTPEEKRAICFVLCAVVLGLATKHYRDTHPSLPKPAIRADGKASPRPVSRQNRIPKQPRPGVVQGDSP